MHRVQNVQVVQKFKPSPLSSPATRRDAGEDEEGGLNGLNFLNELDCAEGVAHFRERRISLGLSLNRSPRARPSIALMSE
jgi:hypothetical protein